MSKPKTPDINALKDKLRNLETKQPFQQAKTSKSGSSKRFDHLVKSDRTAQKIDQPIPTNKKSDIKQESLPKQKAAPPKPAMPKSVVPKPAMSDQSIKNMPSAFDMTDLTTQSSFGKIAKIVLLVLAPLILGVVVGQIGTKASRYNQTIRDAGTLVTTVDGTNKELLKLRNILYEHKNYGVKKDDYKVPDNKLIEALTTFRMSNIDTGKIYESNLYEMEQAVIDQLFAFVTDVRTLQINLKKHREMSKEDSKSFKNLTSKARKGAEPYGVYIDTTRNSLTLKFVETGHPICSDNKPNKKGCDNKETKGFLIRSSAQSPWRSMDLATDHNGRNKLYLLSSKINPVFRALQYGSKSTLNERSYTQRIKEIDQSVDMLIKRGKDLERTLRVSSNQSLRFSFFMD